MGEMRCPVTGKTAGSTSAGERSNKDWWPNNLNLKILHQNSELVTPMEKDFNYASEFLKLDLLEVKKDLFQVLTDSKEWWPADYGNYGPLFIRMAWHSAGTYRISDGRGGASDGTQRFPPLNSWPDNVNLDKARRLLWPIKKKYGNKLSWADLYILAGNAALEHMGFKLFGFGGGREDVYEPQEDVYWGSETEWLKDMRHNSDNKLENPLAAVQMGLIYVNPEGPGGVPDAVASGKDVRETFRRMGMNDEETVALIAGGHTFGKCHGAGSATYVGPEPEAAPIEEQGLGWKNSFKSGKGIDTIGSGIEGAWKPNPTRWDMGYLETLFKYDWNLVKSPAGAFQWIPSDPEAMKLVEDAHDKEKRHAPMMTTADLSLRMDPLFSQIARRYLANPDEFEDAFARAWFKLTHRDMGPKSRYLGSLVPEEDLIWQDPVPKAEYQLVDDADIENLKKIIIERIPSVSKLMYTAWSSAATYRNSDKRGGANGGRIALEPQINWEVNKPLELLDIINIYKEIMEEFNNSNAPKKVSLADLIVLGGASAIEKAVKNAGFDEKVPFLKGRTDADINMTSVESFKVLEPKADAFRNYIKNGVLEKPEHLLIDKAQLLNLTAKEMTVLIGGMRVLNVNYDNYNYGVLTDKFETLSNDFFINLLDMDTEWKKISEEALCFNGYDRGSDRIKWKATRVDLIFGSDSQLRAIAEIYGADDAKEKFIKDFIKTWNKVMNVDRFDTTRSNGGKCL